MKLVNKRDIVIIFAVLMMALLIYIMRLNFSQTKLPIAEIYYNQDLVMTVDLDKKIDKTFSIPQNNHVVFHLFKDGSICFEESDCPDKVCIRSGKLRRVGESAACLPNKIILKIVPKHSRSKDDLDMIAR
ncbi:NusG domain II-containing protein [Sedimentibacter sp. zth1]|uniref:NusG domain II-containing protein n=1 Tax=Sedimentibacter sp. zth1 TaxID=2816908 RepID=UPI001A9307D1|nr:NusG domain II-containing protein [Sedimentibacter sp. zth1]QSX07017.1 NusG domain II-containing protein [Sedimentibacter sp. zth1]